MSALLETVPNFSEGRDRGVLRALIDAMQGAGVDVLDASMDPDHHRSVITAVGGPDDIVLALTRAAEVALECIDLTRHRGVHPRVGALDVAPVVPLAGTARAVAEQVANRVGHAIAGLGIPVWWYAWSSPDGARSLGQLRRGGFEALRDGFPADRRPDLPARFLATDFAGPGAGARHTTPAPHPTSAPHPTAGVTCVGARPLLLAWNVEVEDVEFADLRQLASRLREAGGGFEGLRALALDLPEQGRRQLSMNLEDVERRDTMAIFEAIERAVAAVGGRVCGTEVIGMIPDALVFPAAHRRLHLLDAGPERLLSGRLTRYLAQRASGDR